MTIWTNGLHLENMDPDDEDDYIFKWGGWLNGANIDSAVVTGTNITVDSQSVINGNQDVTCRLSAPVAGSEATVSCKVTTDDATPRVAERSFKMWITDL